MSKKYGLLTVYRAMSQATTHIAEAQVASAVAYKAHKVEMAEKALAKIKNEKIKEAATSALAELW